MKSDVENEDVATAPVNPPIEVRPVELIVLPLHARPVPAVIRVDGV